MARGYEEQLNSVRQPVTYPSPAEIAGEHPHPLCLTVLFTTVPDTLAALHEAAQLAHELGANIRILVPHVVPYPLPIDQPRVDPGFRLRQFRRLCEQKSVETRIEVYLCRDAYQCVRILPSHSLVVVGESQSRWPWSFGRRVTKALKAAGHQVVTVALGTRR